MALAGNYTLRSQLPNNIYLATSVSRNLLFAPIVGQSPPETGKPQIWEIIPAGNPGSNLYTIHRGSNYISLDPNATGLRMYFLANISKPAVFFIDQSEDKLVHFHIPNEKNVWTLADDISDKREKGIPITLKPDMAVPGQRWSLMSALD